MLVNFYTNIMLDSLEGQTKHSNKSLLNIRTANIRKQIKKKHLGVTT